MARFMRLDVIGQILTTGLLPLFYQSDLPTSIAIVEALCQGGAHVIEFTNRGEEAYPVFVELVRHFAKTDPDIILGVGSILDAPTAALYLASGANFVVGPNFQVDIARLCNRRKVLYMPGCATETEISNAEEYGAEICKIFPGETVGGPGFIRAVLAPCPWHRLLPTGGVEATESNITAWINAGACALGMGSKLISAQLVKAGSFETISQTTNQCIEWIRAARQP